MFTRARRQPSSSRGRATYAVRGVAIAGATPPDPRTSASSDAERLAPLLAEAKVGGAATVEGRGKVRYREPPEGVSLASLLAGLRRESDKYAQNQDSLEVKSAIVGARPANRPPTPTVGLGGWVGGAGVQE
jgi:hypothetical protein